MPTLISVRMVYDGLWSSGSYGTGLKEGIQGLGALRRSERWAEGALMAALIDTF